MMKNILFLGAAFLFGIFALTFFPSKASAGYCPHPTSPEDSKYDAHCGIWICAPGGFPSTCSKQKSAFKWRLKKRKCSALPRYSGCVQGGNGSYRLGQAFKPCEKEGYNLVVTNTGDDRGSSEKGTCMNSDNSCERRTRDRGDVSVDRSRCGDYGTPKKNFIDVTTDGITHPRYWW
jgi:hypothetical protein